MQSRRKQFLMILGCITLIASVGEKRVESTYKPEAHTSQLTAEVIEEVQPKKVVVKKSIVKEASVKPVEELQKVLDTPESSRVYYKIPNEFKERGGSYSKRVQDFLWDICEERNLDFYIVTAQIEVESGYQIDITGDNGASKGYLQVQERWHKKRMQEERVTDLYNPFENIKVGTNCLKELYEKYGEWHKALMCYNMGESRAKELWSAGKYSTEYSVKILTRAEEIRKELEEN